MAKQITNEDVYEVYWEGPFTEKQFKKQLKRKKAPNAWVLYAMVSDHPLYGKDVITYIGKAVLQPIETRIEQHKWWAKKIYVASVYKFDNWQKSNDDWGYSESLIGEDNNPEISKIEELLIYSMAPSGNQRNKNTAKDSETIRIFNTGEHANIAGEISGYYQLEHMPDPTVLDKE